MQILQAEQVRAWDQYTIQNEPISSIDLMERAAKKCVDWLLKKHLKSKQHLIFCGKGNNGGDGLAIARLLLQNHIPVSVYIVEFGKIGSPDFQINLQRLHELPNVDIHFIQSQANFPPIGENDIVIDAVYGSGLKQPLEGLSANLVNHLNASKATIVSIDVPSGLFMDKSSLGSTAVRASFTLSFQCYKLALLVQENAPFIGEVHMLDIGLKTDYLATIETSSQLLDEKMIRNIFKPRERFDHKGTYGHAFIVGGSYGKIGAVVLATKACMRSGAGLTTAFVPKCGYNILQISAPEAMTITDEEENQLSSLPDDIEKFSAIGIGPGMGTKEKTQQLLSFFIRRYKKPLVIDADGLNNLALHPDWLALLPSHSILTPHPKEFDRLFGEHQNDFARMETATQKAKEYNIILVLKSHHSLIALPDGSNYFNSTGNAGMAKGGSGDVLTGIITSLLAQGYKPADAALLGVNIHGWAGDIAAKKFSKEAMLPSHLSQCLGEVFLKLQPV